MTHDSAREDWRLMIPDCLTFYTLKGEKKTPVY